MRMTAKISLPLFVLFITVCTAFGQQVNSVTYQSGTLPPQATMIIRNAHIVTVSGPEIPNGSLLIRNGKIEAVGNVSTVPAGAVEIDATGLTVFPGMIDAGTSIGLVEIPTGAPGTVDTSETGDMNPNAMAIVSISPYSAHIGVTRVNGITNAVSLPQGGVISGQAALINLAGTTPSEMAVLPTAGLVINYPRA